MPNYSIFFDIVWCLFALQTKVKYIEVHAFVITLQSFQPAVDVAH